MKYVPPLGATDPNASYQDGNPEAGILGSIVPAAAIERPQREILNVLTAAGLTPSDTDLTQLLAAIRKIIGTQNAELERLRLLKIGCPMYWRSTTLPEGFAWVNGDLVLFEDWPEFAAVYNAGGFPVWCCLIMPTAQPLPPTSANSARMPLTPRDYTFLRVANSFSELGRGAWEVRALIMTQGCRRFRGLLAYAAQ